MILYVQTLIVVLHSLVMKLVDKSFQGSIDSAKNAGQATEN